MESTNNRWQISEGAEVVGSEGDKIGKVTEVNEAYIVVEKGWFLPSDHYIPVEAIADVDGKTVRLNVTKHDAVTQGWDQQLNPRNSILETSYAQGAGAVNPGVRDTTTHEGGIVADESSPELGDKVNYIKTDTKLRNLGINGDPL